MDARACVGEVVRVGKVPSAQLRLPDDAESSRLHAVIEIIEEGVRLIDLGSASGTVINGTVVRTSGYA
jgi:pSer/pThr/pTyr-binding forkhead associated (FHA) protein